MLEQSLFGKTKDGKEGIVIYSLSNEKGLKAEVMNYGAILMNLYVPNKKGRIEDITPGYDRLEKYFSNSNFFGASVGPIANRTANASFELDGKTYKLDVNDGENNLHTHFDKGFHKRMFKPEPDFENSSVTFTLTMEDGE
ncbi:MAG: galactose-1-epimerase, partial [Lachnospiraceae bacterium]|nr:galactose-1-epimerase [Lachnospiraceae bacterium]